MSDLLSREDKIEIIKKVFQSTSPYYSGEKTMNLIPALAQAELELDTWMLWLEDPELQLVFESEQKKSMYQKKFAANQIVDETLSWMNNAPTTVQINIAKDMIQEAPKKWDDSFTVPNEEEIYEKIWDFYKSIQKRISVDKKKNDE